MAERIRNSSKACADYEPDLVLQYYGELDEIESRRVDEHLKACASCRQYLEALGTLLPLTMKDDSPPQEFWDNYSRELRSKLDEVASRDSWWQRFLALFRSWPVPTVATAMVVLLALTLTLGRNGKNGQQAEPVGEANPDIVLMVREAEFFKNLELLDSLDALESQGGSINGSESL